MGWEDEADALDTPSAPPPAAVAAEPAPSFLKPRGQRSWEDDADELEAVAAEPVKESRPLANTGADLVGQLRAEAAAVEATPFHQRIADVVNGVGTMATNAADSATVGAYTAARNSIARRVAPEAAARTEEAEAGFNQNHPFLASGSHAAGYFVPGAPAARLAEGVGAGVKALTSSAPKAVSRALASRAGAGAATGGSVAGGTTLAEEVTDGVPLREALGDAGESALTGAALGATIGAGQATAAKIAKGAPQRVSDRFREQIGEKTGVKNTRGIAQKADEIDSLVERHPELRKVADKPKEFVGKAEDIAAAKGEQARSLLDDADKRVAEATGAKGNGGFRLGNMLNSMDDVAAKHASEPGTVDVSDAVQRNKAKMLRAWGEDPDKLIPSQRVRKFASDLQDEGFSHKTETASATAAQDASKSVLDHVNKHVTGMGYAEGRASTDAAAQKYYQLNDDLTSLSRVKAAMKAKLDKPPGERANRLSTIVRAAAGVGAVGTSIGTGSVMPVLAAGAMYGYPKVAAAADRIIARGAGKSTGALGRAALEVAPREAAAQKSPPGDRALAQLVQAAQSGADHGDLLKMAEANGMSPFQAASVIQRFSRPGGAP